MPNTLFIKLVADHIVSVYRVSQDYSDPWLQNKVDAYADEFIGGASPVGFALAHCETMAAAEATGKEYIPGPAGGGDFDVIQKSAITTETAIPPEGMTLDSLADDDYVVCYV
ncbi:unnamed protein product [marine sediment metagenome]|uniref:Uncharacterized protein n=1 Tax=marine sediment metagenome TaxID=412755 RepID=X0XH49_9ZZZZ